MQKYKITHILLYTVQVQAVIGTKFQSVLEAYFGMPFGGEDNHGHLMCTMVGVNQRLKGGCEEPGNVGFLHFLKFGKDLLTSTTILILYGGHNKPQ